MNQLWEVKYDHVYGSQCVTNSMEQSHFEELIVAQIVKIISRLLGNQKVYYIVCRRPHLLCFLGHMNPTHTLSQSSCTTHFNIILPVMHRSSKGIFSFGVSGPKLCIFKLNIIR